MKISQVCSPVRTIRNGELTNKTRQKKNAHPQARNQKGIGSICPPPKFFKKYRIIRCIVADYVVSNSVSYSIGYNAASDRIARGEAVMSAY